MESHGKLKLCLVDLVTLQMSNMERKKVSWRQKINQGERHVLWWTPDFVSVELSLKILKVTVNLRHWKPGKVP